MLDVTTEARRIGEAFIRLSESNREPAVAEPANEFEVAVNQHYDVVGLVEESKKLMKLVLADELEQRKALAETLRTHHGDKLKEGNNDYKLSNGRKLKLGHEIERKIADSEFANSREAFTKADDVPAGVTYDGLFRVKFELNKTEWKKLPKGGEAFKALGQAIVTKFKTPTLKVD